MIVGLANVLMGEGVYLLPFECSFSQWTTVKKLVKRKTGYFRIREWDELRRETVSEVRSFTIE